MTQSQIRLVRRQNAGKKWSSKVGYSFSPMRMIRGGIVTAAVALTAVSVSSAHADDVLFVNVESAPGGDGSSWAAALPTLREALEIAHLPDSPISEIWVAQGTYAPGESDDIYSSFVLRSVLALYGGFAGGESSIDDRDWTVNETILTGDVGDDDVYGSGVWYIGWDINTPNSLHVLTAQNADATAILDGFTITAGRATSSAGGGLTIVGGGPTIQNCTFLRNLAAFGHGGGVYVHNSQPTFINCFFTQNWVHLGQGAGIYAAGSTHLTVTDCAFTENRSIGTIPEAAGGGIATSGAVDLEIERSIFQSNIAENFYASGGMAGGYGGAIHHLGGELAIRDSQFFSNRSNAGGAIWTWRDALIVNCYFRNNLAPEYQAQQGGWGGIGGAIGASAFNDIVVHVINCTVVQNTAKKGGGLRFLQTADADVVNCVLWANSDENGTVGTSQIKGAGASNSCIHNMLVGEPGEDPPDPEHFPECFDDDPMFVALGTGDVHLLDGSPCIDTGLNLAVPAGVSEDLDGEARITDGNSDGAAVVDLGVFEFRTTSMPGDLNNDGVVNVSDLLLMLGEWGACADCGSCPADINGDCSANVSDLLLLLANWG